VVTESIHRQTFFIHRRTIFTFRKHWDLPFTAILRITVKHLSEKPAHP